MNEYRRRSALGQFGEAIVLDHLAKDGYTCTRLGGHHRCFDILASKADKKYLVSVKTRNHTTHKNDEKRDSWNLLYAKKKGDHPDTEVIAAAALEWNITPMRSGLPSESMLVGRCTAYTLDALTTSQSRSKSR